MKIGRNDPCPCGSGKKYKKCCLPKESASTNTLLKMAVQDAGYNNSIADVLCNLNDYMQKQQWWGACHASSSALYVALSELGYHPILCIGELMGGNFYFDHSWIELDGKILDMAINMTLFGGVPASDPIIFGKNIRSGLVPMLKYGVRGRGIEGEALNVLNTPFPEYMDKYPYEKDGLWGVVQVLLGQSRDIPLLRKKYQMVERKIIIRD